MRLLPRSARAAVLLPIAAAVVLVGGCGGDRETTGTTAAAPSSGPSAVKIVDYAYAPPEMTVAAGSTVKFTNQDSTAHTVTSKGSGAFDSGTIEPGKTGEITLDKAGTYSYYCVFHPFMKGTVTVE
jgi:plastocyanin